MKEYDDSDGFDRPKETRPRNMYSEPNFPTIHGVQDMAIVRNNRVLIDRLTQQLDDQRDEWESNHQAQKERIVHLTQQLADHRAEMERLKSKHANQMISIERFQEHRRNQQAAMDGLVDALKNIAYEAHHVAANNGWNQGHAANLARAIEAQANAALSAAENEAKEINHAQ